MVLTLYKKYRQIASVQYVSIEFSAFFDQILEMGVHFGRPSGNVDRGYAGRPRQNLQHLIDRLFGHDFCSLGACIHMAMMTGLIAKLSDIDLQGGQRGSFQGSNAMLDQDFRKGGSHGQRRRLG